MVFSDLTLVLILTRAAAFLLIAGCCGFAMAAGAWAMGDAGIRRDGRLSLNPLVHLDLFGLLTAMVLGFGWIKPLYPLPKSLRSCVGAIVAGLAMALLLGLAAQLLLPWLLGTGSYATGQAWGSFTRQLTALALGFVVLNILPLPPLLAGLAGLRLFAKLDGLYGRAGLMFSLAMVAITAALAQSGLLLGASLWLTGLLR